MRGVLADVGPLYALVDKDDQYHVRAQAEARRLRRERVRIAAAYPTVFEAYSLILRRLSARTAHRWLQQIEQGSDLLNPSKADYWAAFDRVRRFKDQPITLFDAVVAQLSNELELPVWTYDHHFDVMGASVWR